MENVGLEPTTSALQGQTTTSYILRNKDGVANWLPLFLCLKFRINRFERSQKRMTSSENTYSGVFRYIDEYVVFAVRDIDVTRRLIYSEYKPPTKADVFFYVFPTVW